MICQKKNKINGAISRGLKTKLLDLISKGGVFKKLTKKITEVTLIVVIVVIIVGILILMV